MDLITFRQGRPGHRFEPRHCGVSNPYQASRLIEATFTASVKTGVIEKK
jgi:hypothetical protein